MGVVCVVTVQKTEEVAVHRHGGGSDIDERRLWRLACV